MPEPKSAFVDCYCPDCGQLLRVTSTNPDAVFRCKGEPFVISKYECSGEARHRWEDFAFIGDGGTIMDLSLGRPRLKS